MTIIVNEEDIAFCVDAIKLIKDNNATYVKKDTSAINDKCVDIFKNSDDELVIKFKEKDYVKAADPQPVHEEQPYKGSPLERIHKLQIKLEQAKEFLKKWIGPIHDRDDLLYYTKLFLDEDEEER